jgi:hypothetical protein
VRKADAANAPALTEAQASAIREFMATTGEPAAALAQVRALAGRKADRLQAALDGWSVRLAAIAKATPPTQLRFSPSLGHAFDYYDGLTFEVVTRGAGPRPAGGGGPAAMRAAGPARLWDRRAPRAVGCMVPALAGVRGGRGHEHDELIIAVPSKGRLKEQVEEWLADCGLDSGCERRRATAIWRGLNGLDRGAGAAAGRPPISPWR